MKLNPAQLAALARGASPEEITALASASDPVAAPAADPAVAASAPATEGAITATTGATEPAATAPATTPAAAATVPAADTALVDHLKAELATANAALIQAKVDAENFKAQAASVDGLVTTLRAALGERLVALGASADTAATFTASNIAAEYARIDAVFKKQFRVGGVAAVPSPDEKQPKADIDPMFAEALKHSIVK